MGLCLCVVFVFQQMTAYDIRISDWSSDVCSSDLGPTIPPRKAVAPLDRCNLPNRGNRRTDKRIRVSAPDFLLQAGIVIGDRVRMDGKKLGNPSRRRAARRDLGCSLKHPPGRVFASAILSRLKPPEQTGLAHR